MSNRRTIFDIYRQKDFSQKPPVDAWNRLEKKLDEKPIHRRLYFWNKFSIAATFLLLVAMAFLANFMLKNHNASQQFASLDAPAEMVEDFDYLNEFQAYAEELATMKAYRNVFDAYFDTGVDDAAYAVVETGTDKDDEYLDMMDPEPNRQLAISEGSRMNQSKMKLVESYASEDLSDDFQQFSWLKGDWVPEQKLQAIQTSWVVKDSNVILGKGYRVEGDDTLVFEKIALKKMGDKIYLVDESPNQPNPVNYQMAYAQADTQWVFSGEGKEIFINHKPGAHYTISQKNEMPAMHAFSKKEKKQGIINGLKMRKVE
ncbi:MAG: hypothetical protein R2769_06060 [Saprospiraceae bacterium]